MNAIIVKAIAERRAISLDYSPGSRTIEPCAYGVSADGHFLLRAFQTSGASASEEHIDWKLFRVDRIRSLRLLDQQFAGPRPGYRRGDRAMTRGVLAQL